MNEQTWHTQYAVLGLRTMPVNAFVQANSVLDNHLLFSQSPLGVVIYGVLKSIAVICDVFVQSTLMLLILRQSAH